MEVVEPNLSCFKSSDGANFSIDISQIPKIAKILENEGKPIGKESFLFEPSYGVNSAKTKRWTAAYHGVPSMSDSRQCFVSRYGENGFFVHFDYSQMELRVIAAVSEDKVMLDAFINGKDLHRMLAASIYNIPEEEVVANQRALAKSANFGLVYDKSPAAFAQEYMNNDIAGAEELFNKLYKLYSGMRKWVDVQKKRMKEIIKAQKGKQIVESTIETMWGDPIRHMFNPHNQREMSDTMRYCFNWRIQSTASNIAGLSIGRANDWVKQEGMRSKFFGFIHDAGEADVPGDELFTMLEKIPEVAEDLPLKEFGIPVKIDVEIGTNLGGLVEMKRNKKTGKFVSNGVLDVELEGSKEDIKSLVDRFRKNFANVSFEVKKEKSKLESWDIIFSIKGCYYNGLGKEKDTCEGRLIVSA
jgi:hypothetical protein